MAFGDTVALFLSFSFSLSLSLSRLLFSVRDLVYIQENHDPLASEITKISKLYSTKRNNYKNCRQSLGLALVDGASLV